MGGVEIEEKEMYLPIRIRVHGKAKLDIDTDIM